MTITERPTQPPVVLPHPTPPPRGPSAGGPWWMGPSAVVAVIALAVAMVALVVALDNSASTRNVATTPGGAQPATNGQPAAAAASAVQPFTDVNISLSLAEYRVSLPALSLSAGTKTLQITNAGTMQHELLVFHPDASIDWASMPIGPDNKFNEDAPGVNKVSDGDNIDPGNNQSRQVDLTQPGTYYFVCNLPGHYKLGMWTKVTVK
jgi:uncharacterized cupredoxin-like copper-binding protein